MLIFVNEGLLVYIVFGECIRVIINMIYKGYFLVNFVIYDKYVYIVDSIF